MNRTSLHGTRIGRLIASTLLTGGIITSIVAAQTTQPAADKSFPVQIAVDLGAKIGPYKPIHRFYGADEPNYAYMPHGMRLLGEIGKTSPDAPVYFRAHSLFCTGDGTPAFKWGS